MKNQVSLLGGEDVEVGKNGFSPKDGEQGDLTESSSIGGESSSSPLASSEEEDISKEEGEEAESKADDGALGCLDCLEESLPVKRGLSLFFSGKSKSFTSLSDVANMTANDLIKSENYSNKRRRILIANKMRRTPSYRSLIGMSLLSPPPLFQNHISEEAGADDEESQSNKENNNLKCFGSNRSFSLSNLQHA